MTGIPKSGDLDTLIQSLLLEASYRVKDGQEVIAEKGQDRPVLAGLSEREQKYLSLQLYRPDGPVDQCWQDNFRIQQ